MNIDQVTLAVYFFGMLLIGAYFSRKHTGSESFLLADRDLGSFHVAASSFSTFFGAGFAFFLASLGYEYGLSAMLILFSALVGFVVFLRFSQEIQERSAEQDSVTIPQLLDDNWSNRTQVLASLILIFVFSAATGAQFIVAGTVINQIFNYSVQFSALSFGILVIIYTVLGGFKSVTWSDIVQMAVIFVGMVLLLLPLSLLNHWNKIISLPPSHISQVSMPLPIIFAYLLLGIFAYYGSQDLFQRIYASREPEDARRGLIYFGSLMLGLSVVFIFLGMVARAVTPGISPDNALPALTSQIVPVGVTGLVLASFVSLANSSADSQLLTVTSNILEDFIKKKSEISGEKALLTNRVLVILMGVLALGTTLLIPSIQEIFNSVGSWLGILGFTVFTTLKWEIESRTAFYSLLLGFTSANIFAFTTGMFSASALVGIITSALIVAAFKVLNLIRLNLNSENLLDKN